MKFAYCFEKDKNVVYIFSNNSPSSDAYDTQKIWAKMLSWLNNLSTFFRYVSLFLKATQNHYWYSVNLLFCQPFHISLKMISLSNAFWNIALKWNKSSWLKIIVWLNNKGIWNKYIVIYISDCLKVSMNQSSSIY